MNLSLNNPPDHHISKLSAMLSATSHSYAQGPGPSMKQSRENYDVLCPRTKAEIVAKKYFLKVTSVIVLDELLRKGLVSKEFHKKQIGQCLIDDKKEQNIDMFWSMMIAAMITGYFIVYIIPQGQYYWFKFFFGCYISVIIYIGSLFRGDRD